MNNIIGLMVSVGYVFIIVGILYVIKTRYTIPLIYRRKLVHILISNWWIILMLFFDNVIYASVFPLILLILNIASHKLNILDEVDEVGNGFGTIYYPLSMLILVIFSFGFVQAPYLGLLGIMIMGYGDGLASIIGHRFGNKRRQTDKTWLGSIVMYLTSLLITIIVVLLYSIQHPYWIMIIIPIVSTLLEAYGEKGIDNLTVPIASSFLFFLLLL